MPKAVSLADGVNNTARGVALAAWTPYMALFLGDPTAGGLEFDAANMAGYARQPVTFSASSGGTMQNSATVAFTAGEDWPTALYAGFFDAVTGGTLKRYGQLGGTVNDRTLLAGQTMQFVAGAIVWREAA